MGINFKSISYSDLIIAQQSKEPLQDKKARQKTWDFLVASKAKISYCSKQYVAQKLGWQTPASSRPALLPCMPRAGSLPPSHPQKQLFCLIFWRSHTLHSTILSQAAGVKDCPCAHWRTKAISITELSSTKHQCTCKEEKLPSLSHSYARTSIFKSLLDQQKTA